MNIYICNTLCNKFSESNNVDLKAVLGRNEKFEQTQIMNFDLLKFIEPQSSFYYHSYWCILPKYQKIMLINHSCVVSERFLRVKFSDRQINEVTASNCERYERSSLIFEFSA